MSCYQNSHHCFPLLRLKHVILLEWSIVQHLLCNLVGDWCVLGQYTSNVFQLYSMEAEITFFLGKNL
jgi:hypothetical protein